MPDSPRPGQTSLSNWKEGSGTHEEVLSWRSPGYLRELCYEKGLKTAEIAERCDCSPNVVRYWTDKFGIERPTPNKDATSNPASFSITKRGYAQAQAMTSEGVRQMYIHRLVAIAEFGVDSVKDKIVHHENGIPWDNRPENLSLMTQSEHATHHALQNTETGVPWQQRDILKELYIDEGLSLKEVGEKLGCSTPTVLRWMKKHGIERRESG